MIKSILNFLALACVVCGCCGRGGSSALINRGAFVNDPAALKTIAAKIVSIELGYGNAMSKLNNSNAGKFVTEVGLLVDDLKKISKELDAFGSFSESLRRTTLQRLDEVEKELREFDRSKQAVRKLQSETVKLTSPVVERYMTAHVEVLTKAGLLKLE